MFDVDAYFEQARRMLFGPPPGRSQQLHLNYTELRGDTGPLVYPAGHAWLHAGLLLATSWDADTWTTAEDVPKPMSPGSPLPPPDVSNYTARVHRPVKTIRVLQRGYAGLHVATLALAAAAAAASGLFDSTGRSSVNDRGQRWWTRLRGTLAPLFFCVLLSASRRVRSVVALGLFNDAFAMLFAHAAVVALAHRRWTLGAVLLSAGTSVKMNVLLFAPGLLFVLLQAGGVPLAARGAAAGAALQLVLAAPFLAVAPRAYITRAFDFGRAFDQQWSVNLAWLPAPAFMSHALATGLLVLHISLLAAAARWLWVPMAAAAGEARANEATSAAVGYPLRSGRRSDLSPASPAAVAASQTLADWLRRGTSQVDSSLSARAIVYIMYTSNFIGIVCARSLHFHFLTWYWHSLPLLLAHTRLPWPAHLAYTMALELLWNRHPPQAWSAAGITALHIALLVALWDGRRACLAGGWPDGARPGVGAALAPAHRETVASVELAGARAPSAALTPAAPAAQATNLAAWLPLVHRAGGASSGGALSSGGGKKGKVA